MLGGFVIHGDAGPRLRGALESLRRSCDFVVAVDSSSTDGSAKVSAELAHEVVTVPWAGYGASRRVAMDALKRAGARWAFFLDSDEELKAPAVETLRRFAESLRSPELARKVNRRNWVHAPRGSYLYSVDHRVRLFPVEAAAWTDGQIVHEAFPPGDYPRLALDIEHHFWEREDVRAAKVHRYALLWAVQAAAEGRHRLKEAAVQRPWNTMRELLVRGALFRGGAHAARVAWLLADYHGLKYAYLARVLAGEFAELRAAYEAKRFAELFTLVGPRVAELLAG